MIYVEENSYQRQLDLLALVSKNETLEIVLWMYPEVKVKNFLGFELIFSDGLKDEPVTTYEGSVRPLRTKRIGWEHEFIKLFFENKKDVEKCCDSLVLYRKCEDSWLCCSVGHEGMCLVRDEKLLKTLESCDFNASLTPPSWW